MSTIIVKFDEKRFDKALSNIIRDSKAPAIDTSKCKWKSKLAGVAVLGSSGVVGVCAGLGIVSVTHSGLIASILAAGTIAGVSASAALPPIGIIAGATIVTIGGSILMYRAIVKGRKYRRIRKLNKSIKVLQDEVPNPELSKVKADKAVAMVRKSEELVAELKKSLNDKPQGIINRCISDVSCAISSTIMFVPKLICKSIKAGISKLWSLCRKHKTETTVSNTTVEATVTG